MSSTGAVVVCQQLFGKVRWAARSIVGIARRRYVELKWRSAVNLSALEFDHAAYCWKPRLQLAASGSRHGWLLKAVIQTALRMIAHGFADKTRRHPERRRQRGVFSKNPRCSVNVISLTRHFSAGRASKKRGGFRKQDGWVRLLPRCRQPSIR
jgi:hypothetical protein